MQAIENEDITDLLVPEDDLLTFQAPSYNAIRSAYSKSFKPKTTNKSPITRIEELFPKESSNDKKEDKDPGFSIDHDDNPLLI